jgi:hypothetical protein
VSAILKKRINLNISRPKQPCKEEICDTSQQERPFGLGRVKAEITGCYRTTAEGRTISEKISLCGLNHSHLNAIIGFTFVTRRAGIQQANSDTPVSNNEIRMNVAGSVALTPKSKVFINRVSANAPPRPVFVDDEPARTSACARNIGIADLLQKFTDHTRCCDAR